MWHGCRVHLGPQKVASVHLVCPFTCKQDLNGMVTFHSSNLFYSLCHKEAEIYMKVHGFNIVLGQKVLVMIEI